MRAPNEWDDSIGAPAPCQPIGCDAGYHLSGCVYADADDGFRLVEHGPVKPPYGSPEREAYDREHGGTT